MVGASLFRQLDPGARAESQSCPQPERPLRVACDGARPHAGCHGLEYFCF